MSNVRMALIGCGGIQIRHALSLRRRDEAEIVALGDVSPDQLHQFAAHAHLAEDGPLPPMFTDLTKLYAQIRPDAVCIATPHTLHFEHGIQALEAGCHVLMEKPMVTDVDHAYRIAEKASQAGTVFVIGFNTPCSPEFAYLRDLIRTQELGELELVAGHLSQPWLKLTAGAWRQRPELSGGGQTYDSGAHILNSLCWTVESRVAEVFAFVDNLGTPVDINASINVRFENGVLASIIVGGNCPVSDAHMAYLFASGKVEVDPWNAAWINVYKGAERVKDPPICRAPTGPVDNFLDAILGRAEPRTTPAAGVIHSELMDAIYESARTGRPARPKNRS